MELALTRSRSMTFTCQSETLGVVCEFSPTVFYRARGANQRIDWSLPEMFDLLKITKYQGKASKWIGMCATSWSDNLTPSFGETQIVWGQRMIKGPRPFWRRCLDVASISSVGLLHQLLRWSHYQPGQGGLEELQARSAAHNTFGTLVSSILPCASLEMPIVLVPQWEDRFPRPMILYLENFVTLHMDADGNVNLEPLLRKKTEQGMPSWVSLFAERFVGKDSVLPITGLLHATANADMKVLHAQLLAQCSRHFEKTLVLGCATKTKFGKKSTTATWTSPDLEQGVDGVDRMCYQYTICAVEQCGLLHVDLGAVTDGGWAHGYNIQATQFFTPSGQAWHAVPAVSP